MEDGTNNEGDIECYNMKIFDNVTKPFFLLCFTPRTKKSSFYILIIPQFTVK